MYKDRAIGAVILIAAIAVIIFYGWLIYADLWWWAFLIISTVAVVGVMAIIAWIGWTMATTPVPEPIEDHLPSTEDPSTEE